MPPPRSYIPNKQYLQSIDQFMDLFDNEAMNFYDLSLNQSYVSNVTALAPINMLTAPLDFWYGTNFWPNSNSSHFESKLQINWYLNRKRDILFPSLPSHGYDSPPNILNPAYIISKIQPQAKFVAILRNPTDRLLSDWEFFNKANDRAKFHELVVTAINNFNECLSLVSQLWSMTYKKSSPN